MQSFSSNTNGNVNTIYSHIKKKKIANLLFLTAIYSHNDSILLSSTKNLPFDNNLSHKNSNSIQTNTQQSYQCQESQNLNLNKQQMMLEDSKQLSFIRKHQNQQSFSTIRHNIDQIPHRDNNDSTINSIQQALPPIRMPFFNQLKEKHARTLSLDTLFDKSVSQVSLNGGAGISSLLGDIHDQDAYRMGTVVKKQNLKSSNLHQKLKEMNALEDQNSTVPQKQQTPQKPSLTTRLGKITQAKRDVLSQILNLNEESGEKHKQPINGYLKKNVKCIGTTPLNNISLKEHISVIGDVSILKQAKNQLYHEWVKSVLNDNYETTLSTYQQLANQKQKRADKAVKGDDFQNFQDSLVLLPHLNVSQQQRQYKMDAIVEQEDKEVKEIAVIKRRPLRVQTNFDSEQLMQQLQQNQGCMTQQKVERRGGTLLSQGKLSEENVDIVKKIHGELNTFRHIVKNEHQQYDVLVNFCLCKQFLADTILDNVKKVVRPAAFNIEYLFGLCFQHLKPRQQQYNSNSRSPTTALHSAMISASPKLQGGARQVNKAFLIDLSFFSTQLEQFLIKQGKCQMQDLHDRLWTEKLQLDTKKNQFLSKFCQKIKRNKKALAQDAGTYANAFQQELLDQKFQSLQCNPFTQPKIKESIANQYKTIINKNQMTHVDIHSRLEQAKKKGVQTYKQQIISNYETALKEQKQNELMLDLITFDKMEIVAKQCNLNKFIENIDVQFGHCPNISQLNRKDTDNLDEMAYALHGKVKGLEDIRREESRKMVEAERRQIEASQSQFIDKNADQDSTLE